MKWFRHDSNAHNDAKLQKILMRHGAQGYALYWYCLELIAGKVDSQNYTFELEHDAEILAHQLKIDTLLVEKIMTDMVELGLFESSAGKIHCFKMLKRLDDHTSRNPEIKKIIKGNKLSDTKALRSYSEHSSLITEDDTKSLGPDNTTLHKTKLDKNKAHNMLLTDEGNQFERFWALYPRKVKATKSQEIFISLQLTGDDIERMLEDINQRIESGQWNDHQYIPYPSSYLADRRWLDEASPSEEPLCL